MRLIIVFGMAIIAVVTTGCGNAQLYPVKGRITLDGKPMKGGGSIAFMPIGKQDGKLPGGEIREDGTYEMTTHQPGDGSIEGEFRVIIHQSTEREPEASKDGERTAKSVSLVGKDDIIPRIYSDPTQSPLLTKVTRGANELNFDLQRNAGGPPQQGAWLGAPPHGTFARLKGDPRFARQD